ncbi:MAG: hypothetical protein WBA92_14415 [Pseudorhodobacter sp.]
MTKHLVDHRAAPRTARRKHFWAIEQRGENDEPHHAIRTLTQRPQGHDDGARVQQYVRIARGVRA